MNDEIRCSQFIPYQRARTIRPKEMRQIQRELLDKFQIIQSKNNKRIKTESENFSTSNK